MQARLIAYPPDTAAVSRWLQPDRGLRIGRDPGCDLVIAHPSVSRTHAELYHRDGRWWLRDLGSKNGSFVDGIAVADHPLPAQCWLRLGDSYCDFGELDDRQAEALRDRQHDRRALSQAMALRVSQQSDPDALPAHVLRGVIELSGCTRGFMLLADSAGELVVGAGLQLDGDALDQRVFPGSVGAVERVLASGQPLVINNIGSDAWLSARASVIAGGLTTLVCLPLFDGSRVFGAVYADRSGPGEPITDFDLELLGAFAESATLYLLTRRAMRSIDDAPRWQAVVGDRKSATPLDTST
ncbi:FHA domain-containing protein [Lysobacter yangpyeongensis]|uniref:FHA domain-containing protein n=1 Tax=Lysobacter yangpyeongensis TaxID=346182 RepID=A0ABW0SPX8_9GAMM